MAQICISRPYQRAMLLVSVFLLTCAYSFWALRSYRASRFGTQVSEANLRRAISLEPGNAEFHDRLGQYYFASQDAARATEEYKLAVGLNPHNAYYWLNLASGYEVLDRPVEQAHAIAAATRTGPSTPDVLWTAANLYLVRGDLDQALPLLRRILEVYAGVDYQAMYAGLSAGWRATHDVHLLLQRVLPPRADVHAAFLHLLASNNEVQAASEVWNRIVELGQPVDAHLLFGYIEALLWGNNADSARRVWRQLAGLNAGMGAYEPNGNLIFNSGFEQPTLNAGLDWRIHSPASVSVSGDSSQFHSGTQSLRITFDGDAVPDAGVVQYVPVNPGTRYGFSGYMRAQEVWSQSGPRFQVRDARSGVQYFLTDDVIGSAYWRECSGQFTTGPETRLLAVSVVRTPASSRIKGTLWIDDVSLHEIGVP